jgi:hypothetical protein
MLTMSSCFGKLQSSNAVSPTGQASTSSACTRMHMFKSGLLAGVGSDAEYLADRLSRTL